MLESRGQYPKWLGDLLYDPLAVVRNAQSNTKRNCETLETIYTTSYRVDDKDALLFDTIIECELNVINARNFEEEMRDTIQSMVEEINGLKEEIEYLKNKHEVEKKKKQKKGKK